MKIPVKRMSSNPEDWARPTPPPPPWEMDDRGYIGLRIKNLQEMGRAERQLQQESPLFVQAAHAYNLRTYKNRTREKAAERRLDLRRATR